MPVFQVTLTYLITVDGPIDAETAVVAATNIVQENPEIYNDVEIERVDTWVDTYDPSADIQSILEMLDKYDEVGWEKITKNALSILSQMEREK